MGTPDFAVPALEAIIDLGCQVVGVVSQPNRKKGRGQRVDPTPVAACAVEHSLPIFQWPRLNNDSYAALSALNADVAVVVAYGKILPQRYLNLPQHGCLNVHASCLPKLRGAAPIQWSIVEGHARAGVTIMRLDAGMDTGDTALMDSIEIGVNETAGQLHDRLSPLGAKLLRTALTQICEGSIEWTEQDHGAATHARMLTKADGLIAWDSTAQSVHNHIRGMSPWPGAYISTPKGPIKIHGTEIIEGTGVPGQIIAIDKLGPSIACADGAIRVLRIQRPGKKPVTGAEYVRSQSLELGDRLEGE
jgi:methionyl-tRNA formyltransferase